MKVPGQDGVQNEIEIRKMTKGDYFGEKALLGEGRRTANIYAASPQGVELLCLYRKYVSSRCFNTVSSLCASLYGLLIYLCCLQGLPGTYGQHRRS